MSVGAAKRVRELRVAALQLNSHDRVSENLAQCERLVEKAAAEGARLVVLPECFAFLGPEDEKVRYAERLDDQGAPIQAALKSWARRWKVTILAGGMAEVSADPARPFNSSVLFGEEGQLLAVYRKMHLFDVDLADGTSLRESSATMEGERPEVVSVADMKVGLSVCYDLRFPELYRKEVDQGAEVLTVPAAFTLHTGRDHWHVLLRARAIENQCWVVAAAQWGRHRKQGRPSERVSYGHSLIVDPWGTVVADCSDGVGLVVATVSSEQLDRVRQSVPCLRHRRL